MNVTSKLLGASKRVRLAVLGVVLLGLCLLTGGNVFESRAQEVETTTPIKHLIVLMQENHSFDNYFGTYPGADGFSPDTCVPIDPFDPDNTECVAPFHAGSNTDVQMDDPDHSTETALIQYNEGKMNGFVHALNLRNQDGRLAMMYYDDNDLPYYWNIADEYVLFDRFFSSAQGGSFINHLYWVAAVHDDAPEGQTLQEYLEGVPTIFDRLQEQGITWKFYVQNYDAGLNYRTVDQYPSNRQSQVIWVPMLSFDRFLDNSELSQHIVSLDEYYEDLIGGTLPSVAFMVPSGPSEHPPSSLLSGQRFVRTLIQSLMQSEYWLKSAFIWTYDDWGGWYDHVAPPQVDDYGFGFRVPTLLVSPYAKQGYIDNTELEYTSVLKFIEENWGVEPLTARDANANNIVNAFDFAQAPREARFIPFERETGPEKPAPKVIYIYLAYGAAIVLTVVVIAAAAIYTNRRGRASTAVEKDPEVAG
jgi:phospholipase C